MLSAAEATYVSTHAWLPEHLTEYVRAVSGKEPFLVGDFLCYRGARGLVVVGYPLSQALGNQGLVKALDEINRRFRPSKLWLLAPEIPSWGGLRPTGAPDIYFQLELENLRVPNKVRNMIRRAARELEVQVSPAMGKEHQQLIRDFIASKELSQGSQEILRALPRYVEEVADTVLLNLVDKADRLVSFCVGQMGKGDWGFYMCSK